VGIGALVGSGVLVEAGVAVGSTASVSSGGVAGKAASPTGSDVTVTQDENASAKTTRASNDFPGLFDTGHLPVRGRELVSNVKEQNATLVSGWRTIAA
jgi:hypothetical protein